MTCDICGKEVKDVNNLFDASPFMGFVCKQCKNQYVLPFRMFLIDDELQAIYIPCELKRKELETYRKLSYDTVKTQLQLQNKNDIMSQKFSTELIMVYPEHDVNDKLENVLFKQLMHGIFPHKIWRGDYMIVKEKGWNEFNDRQR